jgi:CRISPR-associated protein Cas1
MDRQDGVRLYADSIGGHTALEDNMTAALVSDEAKRLEVAWRMYRFRFNENILR